MDTIIRNEILVYLSNQIMDIGYKISLSEIQKAQRVLDLCEAMDFVENRNQEKEEEKKPILGALCRVK